MQCTGQNVKSRKRVRCPVSTDKIVMLFMDRFSPNLEHSFTDFSYTNFIASYRDALDRLRVQLNIILFSK